MIEQNSTEPLVSIVIPCYNHEQFVQEAIQSVIDQDYHNIEFIIIDDGSTDGSVEKIKEMIPVCQSRFNRFEFRHQPNKGLGATLNEALKWCEGKYFSPLASDDIALPYKTSYSVEKFKSTECDVVFGLVNEFTNAKNHINNTQSIMLHTFADLLFQKNFPKAPTAMLKVDGIKEIGGYDEKLKIEDWYMWLTLTEKGCKLVTFPQPLTRYRRHEGNITNNFTVMHEARIEVLSHFKNNPMYESAVENAYVLEARRSANVSFSRAMQFLNKIGWFRKVSLLILLKSLTPKLLIGLKRSYMGQKNL